MPPISILPSAKPHPFAGQNIKAFESILKTIGQAETLRRQRLLQSDVLKVISGGGDPQQMMADIANVLTSQMQPSYSSGFPGLAQRIGGMFATPTMGLEDVLSGEMMKSAIVSPREQAMTEYYKARTKEAGKPKPTKIQELIDEGYSREEARMIRDISHGLKPRASARKRYEGMDDVEKVDFLTKLKKRAQGQYFGVEPGYEKAVDQNTLEWVEKELAKLPMFKSEAGTKTEPQLAEPQDKEEFLKTVKSIEDEDEAEAYYNKWVSKWQ